jgi:hypothetical protein
MARPGDAVHHVSVASLAICSRSSTRSAMQIPSPSSITAGGSSGVLIARWRAEAPVAAMFPVRGHVSADGRGIFATADGPELSRCGWPPVVGAAGRRALSYVRQSGVLTGPHGRGAGV